MVVGSNTVVSLKIDLYDAQGALLDSPAEPLSYLHGGHGELLPALEAEIEGKRAGESVEVQLEPEHAFGDYDADLLRVEPADRYGDAVSRGMEVEEDSHIYTVTDMAGCKVVLDGNHPLAGMALRFVCRVLSVRTATPEEISQGVSLPQE